MHYCDHIQSCSFLVITICRGGGSSQKLRRHGGRPQDGCGSQQRGRSPTYGWRPCWGRSGMGLPLPHGSLGCHPRKILKLQMRNPAFWCIFSPEPHDLCPWMPCALYMSRESETISWKNWGLQRTGA